MKPIIEKKLPAIFLSFFLSTFLSFCGCGGGSTNARANNDFRILNCNFTQGLADVKLNERIVLTFSGYVDSSTVNDQTIQIRFDASEYDMDPRDDWPDDSENHSEVAPGTFLVDKNVVTWVPKAPTRAYKQLSDGTELFDYDTGLLRGIEFTTQSDFRKRGVLYSITLPGYPNSDTVRNIDRDVLVETFQLTFRTDNSGGFFDNIPGPPRIVNIRTVSETGEDKDLGSPPYDKENFITGVPRDSEVIVEFSEPILPSSLIHLDTFMPKDILAYLIDEENDIKYTIPSTHVITQLPFGSILAIRSSIGLPKLGMVVLDNILEIKDLAGNTLGEWDPDTEEYVLPSWLGEKPRFMTARGEESGSGSVTVDFTGDEDINPEHTSGFWDKENGLVYPICGGDGADGPFNGETFENFDTDGKPDNYITLDPDRAEGPYRFTRIELYSGYTVSAKKGSKNPLMIYATDEINIYAGALIELNGQKGGDAKSGKVGSDIPKRGEGGGSIAGGGRGGAGGNVNADGTGLTDGDPGEGHIIPTLDDWTGVDYGDGFGGKGGMYVISGAQCAGAGGGGGYKVNGEMGKRYPPTSEGWPGDGGWRYGHFTLDHYAGLLLGGSGGGGGGARIAVYTDRTLLIPGSGGGGGGGALFLISSKPINLQGEISCSGGPGGAKGSDTQLVGPGGGASGGAILIRSHALVQGRISLGSVARLEALLGEGGATVANQYYGGNGSEGRIRLESDNIQDSGAVIDPSDGDTIYLGNSYPFEWSVAVTRWIQTAPWATYFYDPEDFKDNFESVIIPAIEAGLLPAGTMIKYRFQGTRPKEGSQDEPSENPRHWTKWRDNISEINNLPFVRVMVEFVIPFNGQHRFRKDDAGFVQPPFPEAYEITFRYTY